MERSLSIIKHCSTFLTALSMRQVLQALVSTFLTTLSTRQVLQALVLSHLDYCSVVWSGDTKRNLRKLQLPQNRAARLALGCTQRTNINDMHVNLYWLKVEEIDFITTFIYERYWHVECTELSVWTTGRQLGHPCIPQKTCHKRSFHSPQVQNKLWEVHSTT